MAEELKAQGEMISALQQELEKVKKQNNYLNEIMEEKGKREHQPRT